MFYSHDILKRKGGKFGIIWLAAFREKMLTRRDVFSVDVEKSCNDVIEYVIRTYRTERPRFSLYLSSQLLYGSVRVYRKQTMYLCGDATEMMVKLAAFQGTLTAAHIDLDPTMKPHHVTFPENFIVSDPYFGTTYVPSLDLSFTTVHEEEFIRVAAINGFYSSSPMQLPAPATSPPPGKDDTIEDFTDKEQDISFRPEVGGPLQASPESITMKEAPPFFQAPIIPEIPHGDIELPLELDFQEGRDHLWTEFWKTDEEIARGETSSQEAGASDAQTIEQPAAETRDATLVDDVTIGATSFVLDDRHQAPIHEQTPSVFLDPDLIDMAPRPLPTSPEVTAIIPEPRRQRRRPHPVHDYSFQLDPIDPSAAKRPRRRQLVFADREIQLTRVRMKQNIEGSHETCRPVVYPRPEPTDFRSLFTRPTRTGRWDSRLLTLWRRNTKTVCVTDQEHEREYWTLPSESSPSEGSSPPLEFPKLDLSPVASVERKRTPETSVNLEDQSELMRSADLSLQPSIHSISHEMPLDITPMRSSDESSMSGRPPTKRKRSSKEKRISLEDEMSSIAEIQTSQLPGIPEERQEDRPSPIATAAAAAEMLPDAFEMTQIPEMPEIAEKDISMDLSQHDASQETPEPAVPTEKEIPEMPPPVIKDLPEAPPGEDLGKRRSSLHKELLRLIRGMTRKDRHTSFFEICPHQSTSRKYAASVFAILLVLAQDPQSGLYADEGLGEFG